MGNEYNSSRWIENPPVDFYYKKIAIKNYCEIGDPMMASRVRAAEKVILNGSILEVREYIAGNWISTTFLDTPESLRAYLKREFGYIYTPY